eukprot:gnl/Chilomastix_cuspidata/2562.p1 GENE.gnl/Chilomastix_cuspidata/2562~~gnl/Chilomastix_cuspidata/2562.p1  ORF type:complete len:1330 (-),score=357.65 gnl/Chilomastix_cuspidata/2562:1745-5626(-)
MFNVFWRFKEEDDLLSDFKVHDFIGFKLSIVRPKYINKTFGFVKHVKMADINDKFLFISRAALAQRVTEFLDVPLIDKESIHVVFSKAEVEEPTAASGCGPSAPAAERYDISFRFPNVKMRSMPTQIHRAPPSLSAQPFLTSNSAQHCGTQPPFAEHPRSADGAGTVPPKGSPDFILMKPQPCMRFAPPAPNQNVPRDAHATFEAAAQGAFSAREASQTPRPVMQTPPPSRPLSVSSPLRRGFVTHHFIPEPHAHWKAVALVSYVDDTDTWQLAIWDAPPDVRSFGCEKDFFKGKEYLLRSKERPRFANGQLVDRQIKVPNLESMEVEFTLKWKSLRPSGEQGPASHTLPFATDVRPIGWHIVEEGKTYYGHIMRYAGVPSSHAAVVKTLQGHTVVIPGHSGQPFLSAYVSFQICDLTRTAHTFVYFGQHLKLLETFERYKFFEGLFFFYIPKSIALFLRVAPARDRRGTLFVKVDHSAQHLARGERVFFEPNCGMSVDVRGMDSNTVDLLLARKHLGLILRQNQNGNYVRQFTACNKVILQKEWNNCRCFVGSGEQATLANGKLFTFNEHSTYLCAKKTNRSHTGGLRYFFAPNVKGTLPYILSRTSAYFPKDYLFLTNKDEFPSSFDYSQACRLGPAYPRQPGAEAVFHVIPYKKNYRLLFAIEYTQLARGAEDILRLFHGPHKISSERDMEANGLFYFLVPRLPFNLDDAMARGRAGGPASALDLVRQQPQVRAYIPRFLETTIPGFQPSGVLHLGADSQLCISRTVVQVTVKKDSPDPNWYTNSPISLLFLWIVGDARCRPEQPLPLPQLSFQPSQPPPQLSIRPRKSQTPLDTSSRVSSSPGTPPPETGPRTPRPKHNEELRLRAIFRRKIKTDTFHSLEGNIKLGPRMLSWNDRYFFGTKHGTAFALKAVRTGDLKSETQEEIFHMFVQKESRNGTKEKSPVAKLRGGFYKRSQKTRYLVFSLYDTSLREWVRSERAARPLSSLPDCWHIAVRMLRAVDFLHNKVSLVKICHGAINPDHFLLNLPDKASGRGINVWITNFGKAGGHTEPIHADTLARIEEDDFCASEFVQDPPPAQQTYSTQADVFSLGATILFLFVGREPDHPFGREANIVGDRSLGLSTFYSLKEGEDQFAELDDMLRRTLDPNPDMRSSVSQLLQHPLFFSLQIRVNIVNSLDPSKHDLSRFKRCNAWLQEAPFEDRVRWGAAARLEAYSLVEAFLLRGRRPHGDGAQEPVGHSILALVQFLQSALRDLDDEALDLPRGVSKRDAQVAIVTVCPVLFLDVCDAC